MTLLTDTEIIELARSEEAKANQRLREVFDHYDRRLRNWTFLNAAWTLVLAIASLFWWLR